ncbi:MAG: Mrr restriction system protein [Chloroflexi bacterium]|nr:Mrr restriction system protein [Chloroflexota bacterium]
MADVTLGRISVLLRGVFELLWTRQEGMPAKEVLSLLPDVVKLTEYELGYSTSANTPKYEKMVRLATIPLVKAGWMMKSDKGRWFLTESGRQACRKYPKIEELYAEAIRLYEESRKNYPLYKIAIEEAEERSWTLIQNYLQEASRIEIQKLVADLVAAMGYHVTWMAPPERDHGPIDIVAYVDPIGAKGLRILTQVSHKGQAVTLEGLKAFSSTLSSTDFGLFVATGGFTVDVMDHIGTESFKRITLVDMEGLYTLWVKFYSQMDEDAKSRLPLKAVHFLNKQE